MTAPDTLRDTAPWDVDGDKLREECGIFGVIGTKEAAAMVALGLHALQHRSASPRRTPRSSSTVSPPAAIPR